MITKNVFAINLQNIRTLYEMIGQNQQVNFTDMILCLRMISLPMQSLLILFNIIEIITVILITVGALQ